MLDDKIRKRMLEFFNESLNQIDPNRTIEEQGKGWSHLIFLGEKLFKEYFPDYALMITMEGIFVKKNNSSEWIKIIDFIKVFYPSI